MPNYIKLGNLRIEIPAASGGGGGGGGGGSSSLLNGLQAFYKLSDTSDSSGNNRTLTNNGNISFASGKIGNAAVFDGSNYLALANNPLNDASQFAMSFWFNSEIQSGQRGLLSSWDPNNTPGQFLFYKQAQGNLAFSWFNSGGSYNELISSGMEFPFNQWNHAVVVSNGSQLKGFVNGTLVATKEFEGVQLQSTISELLIGANAEALESQKFEGQIDAVGIWNRALSDSEVAALYNNGTGLEHPFA